MKKPVLLNIKYLEKALVFAHESGYDVKALPLEEAIERFYNIPHATRKEDFEGSLEKVLEQLPEADRKGYKCALGKYCNQFPRVKPSRTWIPQVLEASKTRVVFQVYPELKATFFPLPSAQHKMTLGWDDIRLTREVLSGSAKIGENTFKKLKRQALAILNQHRARSAAVAA